MSLFATLSVVALAALSQPAQDEVAGRTLIGTPLSSPDFSPEARERLETDLAIARAQMEIAPEREDSYIWLGRRLGYLGRYGEAIGVFSEGIERFPESYKLRRFRARHLARSRQFDAAIADYRRGLELMEGQPDTFEPDGIINARAWPLGTYRSNLQYYLAQTSFAVGDYEEMNAGMIEALHAPILLYKDDLLPPTAYWRYIALMKMGRAREAEAVLATVPDDLSLIENEHYYRGVRVFKGELDPFDDAAGPLERFAGAMQLVFAGETERAEAHLVELVTASPLGFWPAEAEIVRLRE
ncbi:tetratricopeptide repeat protein [Marinicauda sp. Alg238-R41]|uniref:tetratricopeptide repeat protein n=1 Tax=Marinicauda sp. Alg238-R41 TaxID=2993447 RepID=UPI0022E19EC4|nr:tetratricopeptide repeat protein [Marinicauda sp. Alg238-R41]